MTIIENVSKGVAFVHTLKNGIVVLKPTESKSFYMDDLAYPEEILNSPHFAIVEETVQNEEIIEDEAVVDDQGSNDGKSKETIEDGVVVDDQGSNGGKSKESIEDGVSPEEIEAKQKIKEQLLSEAEANNITWDDETLNIEIERLYAESLIPSRESIIEEIKKCVRANNKKRIEELLATIELTDEEKQELFPPKKPPVNNSNNRKKPNKR